MSVFEVEKTGQPRVAARVTTAAEPRKQADLDLQVHYGIGVVRAWQHAGAYVTNNLKPADSLLEENFDRFAVNGFACFEDPNRSVGKELAIDS